MIALIPNDLCTIEGFIPSIKRKVYKRKASDVVGAFLFPKRRTIFWLNKLELINISVRADFVRADRPIVTWKRGV